MCSSDIFLGVLAILFPPLAVWVKSGLCSADSLINILLCMLGYLPGLLHAWYIIAKYPDPEYSMIPQDAESARVTYIIVQSPDGSQRRVPRNSGGARNGGAQGYGTTAPPTAAPVHQEPNGTWNNSSAGMGGEAGSSNAGLAPPTYADAVKGDHKVQTRD
ncbi:hypothetical protein F5884DRAFT_822020 [Xylogone sp. PMI_703]|nr:hypothetical protein F5884DRAFT_822020 [Xylogone sp. PMI_703]